MGIIMEYGTGKDAQRIAELEAEVEELKKENEELKKKYSQMLHELTSKLSQ